MSEPLNRSARFYEALTGLKDKRGPMPAWESYGGNGHLPAPIALVIEDAPVPVIKSKPVSSMPVSAAPVSSEPVSTPATVSTTSDPGNAPVSSDRKEYMRQLMRRKRAEAKAKRTGQDGTH